MAEHYTKIVKEISASYKDWKASTLFPVKERFCIVINGESSTHKTNLARKLITRKMSETGLTCHPESGVVVPTAKSSDKLPSTDGNQTVIFNDFNPTGFEGYVFDLFTSSIEGKFCTKGGYEYNTYIKGSIYPTIKPIETGLSNHVSTLAEFIQLSRRAELTLQIFKKVDIPYGQPLTWNHFIDRLFNVGPTRRGVLETILKHRADLKYKPLFEQGGRTELARDFNILIQAVYRELYSNREMWGDYYDRSQIPDEYGEFKPETHLGTEPNIIRTFKIPTYEGLQKLTISLGFSGESLRLPKLEKEAAICLQIIIIRFPLSLIRFTFQRR